MQRYLPVLKECLVTVLPRSICCAESQGHLEPGTIPYLQSQKDEKGGGDQQESDGRQHASHAQGHRGCLRSKEQLTGVTEARHRDDDSQAVKVGWSKHCIALQECESENDGWQVLVEVGLGL